MKRYIRKEIKKEDKKIKFKEQRIKQYGVDYRKIYRQKVGPIPPKYIIHHIDCNKQNNDISNLIAIHNWFHDKFHSYIKKGSSKNLSSLIKVCDLIEERIRNHRLKPKNTGKNFWIPTKHYILHDNLK